MAAQAKRQAEEDRQREMNALAEKFDAEVKAVGEKYGLKLGALRVQPARFVVADLDELRAALEGKSKRAAPLGEIVKPEFEPGTDGCESAPRDGEEG